MKRGKRSRDTTTEDPTQKRMEQFQLTASLFTKAKEFSKGLGKDHLQCNLIAGGPSQANDLFLKGLKHLGYSSVDELLKYPHHYQFGLHGTSSESNIPTIFEDGFDPALRSRQRLGPGEYFDIKDGKRAERYQGTTNCSIVVLIVNKDRAGNELAQFKLKRNGEVAVVNNPTHRYFCVPCAVASSEILTDEVKDSIASELMEHFTALSGLDTDSPSSLILLQKNLYFQDFYGKWTTQCSRIQRKATAALATESTKFKVRNHTFVDHKGKSQTFDYSFDLRTMTQTNLKTNKTRSLLWY